MQFMYRYVKAYFLLYVARYAQCILSCFIEHKRKDFWEQQIHHVVTVALIVCSYAYGRALAGSS
jgi:acyl-CoA-dependent ceramide synthase